MELQSLTDAGGVNTGARHPRKRFRRTQRRPFHTACAQQAPAPACAGKFCSSEQGVGGDNPTDPLDLDTKQKRKTVSFFYEDKSELLVRVAPHTSHRSPHHRSPLAPWQPLSGRN